MAEGESVKFPDKVDNFVTCSFWCMDCASPVHLDAHLRCAKCGSDAIDTLERVNKSNKAQREIEELERWYAQKG